MRAHVVENGVVTNTVEVASLDFLPGLVDASLGGGIGWVWDGQSFAPPPALLSAVPASVGSGQIRAALIASGVAADDDALSTAIETILANIPDATQRAIAVTLWRNASEFRRDHPFINIVQGALNKTHAEIDDLFRLAATF